jgi:hypothetical protein
VADYIVVESGCWIWQLSVHAHGYGRVNRDGHAYAHRWYYERAKGPIPDGAHVHHTCHNRLCVNPDHLEALSAGDHQRRGVRRRRYTLTPEAVREIRASAASHRSLGIRFGCSATNIASVRTRRTWKDVV